MFVGFLLLLFFFLFALTNFLVIVFHCKRKRPAVISLKMETRKEPTKRRLSVKYCKVDIVQRHIADPHKLHGTEERSTPVIVGVCYTGVVTKAALGFSGLPISANGRGGGLSSGWSSYSRRELPQRSDSHGAGTA